MDTFEKILTIVGWSAIVYVVFTYWPQIAWFIGYLMRLGPPNGP